jgi:hypothetical protein
LLSRDGTTLSFTIWVVGLVAFAAFVYFVRHKYQKSTDRRAKEKKASKNRQSAAELDRKACLELAKGLNASAPSEEGVEKPELPAAPAAAPARATRTRQSSEVAHGYDPDLPPSRT